MRILLALDGSPSSLVARDLTAGLRWPAQTAITLATALDFPIAWAANGLAAGGDWFTNEEAPLRRQAEDALTAMREPLEKHGWTIDQRVVQGRAATAILSAATDVDADLIVVGLAVSAHPVDVAGVGLGRGHRQCRSVCSGRSGITGVASPGCD